MLPFLCLDLCQLDVNHITEAQSVMKATFGVQLGGLSACLGWVLLHSSVTLGKSCDFSEVQLLSG